MLGQFIQLQDAGVGQVVDAVQALQGWDTWPSAGVDKDALAFQFLLAHADAMRGLRAIWIDAGTRDEYHLDLGAQAFRAALNDIGVADDRVHFELFEAGHMGIDYRYPVSLAWLCSRINP